MEREFRDLDSGEVFHYEGSTYCKDDDGECFMIEGFIENNKKDEIKNDTIVDSTGKYLHEY